MDLRQLRYFVALAETGNFHRAAELLHMSQPPLTVAIRNLEKEFGVRLFDRGPRGATLTAAGLAALECARTTLIHADRFGDMAREGAAGERGRLRVGFVGSATFELLPRIIPLYRRRYPLVELILEEFTSTEIARKLTGGELDVGLLRVPLMEAFAIDIRVVDADDMHAALPAHSRFAALDEVPLHALSDETFILQSRVSVLHSITLAACHEAGFVPVVAQEAAQLSAVLALVRSGLGVALVPSRVASAVPLGVRLVALVQRVPIVTGLALRRGGLTEVARNFAAIATDSS